MSKYPLISLVVRTEGRQKLLRRALQSIAGQTYRPIEVVLVNNGAHDLPLDAMKGMLGEVSLRYVRIERNTGRAHSGNAGIAHARGEYIGFLSDGDVLYPEHTATLQAVFEGTDCKVAYSDVDAVSLSYDQHNDIFVETSWYQLPSQDFSSEMLFFEDYIPAVSLLYYGEILRTAGGFDESLGDASDWDLLIRVAAESSFLHSPVRTAQTTCRSMRDEPTETALEEKEYCIRMLQKHAARRTSEAVYRYSLRKKLQRHALEEHRSPFPGKEPPADDSPAHLRKREYERQVGAGVLRDLESRLEDRNRYIEEIEKSTGWKVLNLYRKTLKSLCVPPETKRERIYNLLMKSIAVGIDSGAGVLIAKVKNTIRRTLARKNIRREQYIIPEIKAGTVNAIDTKVSVIIPTRNAGTDFRYVLEKIKIQKGIRDIEIIVMDSCSSDGTAGFAAAYGAKIISLDAAAFNHGATRNLGAEQASGDFIIFMSQDAVPVDDICIHRILTEMLKDEKIAGASIKQIPRSDADLFANWQLWFYNNKLLDYTRDKISDMRGEETERLLSSEKRRLMQLDNVFSCFRKKIFDEFKFLPLPYAEDLDLGMRLVRGGYKLLFLASAGVIHSHTRAPVYFLRRGYVDTKALLNMLGQAPVDWNRAGIGSVDQLLTKIGAEYRSACYFFRTLPMDDLLDAPSERLFSLFKTFLNRGESIPYVSGDPGLDTLFNRLLKEWHVCCPAFPARDDVVKHHYFSFLDTFSEYVNQRAVRITYENIQEFIDAFYKLFAWTAGATIGNYMVFSHHHPGNTEDLSPFEDILGTGV
ncbi:MAG: glycosyltransferase [Thermodesulfovibrionales bacterium]|nr:glycosyltransferase [Thermodesulfovibrionales bacterium]